MVKSCCAVGCKNRWRKGCNISFYRFPSNPERRERWIAAVKRENWHPTEHTWLCSEHFIRKHKSDNPLSLDYVPSVFEYIGSPIKRKLNKSVAVFERRMHARLKQEEALVTAHVQQKK